MKLPPSETVLAALLCGIAAEVGRRFGEYLSDRLLPPRPKTEAAPNPTPAPTAPEKPCP